MIDVEKLPDDVLEKTSDIAVEKYLDIIPVTTEDETTARKLFWERNQARIQRSVGSPNRQYAEPKRAEIVDEHDPELIKYICSKNLKAFAVTYFPHYLKKKSGKMHDELYKILASELNKYKGGCRWAIAAPRGFSKSSLISLIFPLWCIAYEKKKFIVIISATLGQAEDFLLDIKNELLNNERLIRDFPYACGKSERIWRTDEIITKNNVRVKALGTGSQVRGRKFGEYRIDLLIADDIENEEGVRSDVQRDHTRDWFNRSVLFTGGHDEDYTLDVFMIGTIIGKDSLLNTILAPQEYPEFQTKRYQAVLRFSPSPLWIDWENIYKNRMDEDRVIHARKFFEEHKKEMIRGSKVLWHFGEDYYELMCQKARDISAFQQEKQNSAIDPTKVLINYKDLHFERFSSDKIQQYLMNSIKYGAIDPATGKKSKAIDNSAIVTVAKHLKTGLIFVVEIDVKSRPIDTQINDILEKHKKFRYQRFGVETNAFQIVVADNLRKLSRESGVYVPIKEIIQTTDKKLRFDSIVPLLKDGTIVFDKDKYENDSMYNYGIYELTTFTGENDRHDDVQDAISMAVKITIGTKFRLLTQ